MLTILVIAAVVLLAICLVPLALTGDLGHFFKRDGILVAAGIVGIIVAILINLVADKKFGRIDLTSEGKYSVSPEMRHIIDRLGNDNAKLTYYVMAKTPIFEPYKRNMLDKLNEIKNASGGRINIEVIDPSGDPKLMDSLKEKGYVQQLNIRQEGELSFQNFVSGLRITYKDKPSEDIPNIVMSDEVEYQLGSVLIQLTMDKKPEVAVDLPPAPQQQNPMMRQKPQGNGFEWLVHDNHGIDTKKFEAKEIDLSESKTIAKDASLLILVRPKELSERQRYEVEKYLAEGGKVFLVASPFKIFHEFGWKSEKTPTGLEDYLKEVGVSFGQDVIADRSHLQHHETDMFGREMNFDNKTFVRIKPENIDQNNSLTRLMPGLVMPSPAEIKLDKDVLAKRSLTATVLAKTSKESWTVGLTENIDPEKLPEPATFTEGFKPVFVMLEGQFPFPFEGKPIPDWGTPPAPPDKDKPADKDKDKKKSEQASAVLKPGKLVICTAPEAFYAPYISNLGQLMSGNVALISNLSESMSLGEDLMHLRTKRYETRTLAGLAGKDNKDRRDYWQSWLIFGIPAAVLIMAVYRFMIRRVRQLAYERNFANTIGPSSFSK